MMNNFEKPPLDELVHFGVKGMQWGKHKRVDSVNVQTARRNVIDQKQALKTELEKQNRETAYGLFSPSVGTQKAVASAVREQEYARQDLVNAKILDRVNSKPKSKSQLSMEEKYKEKGMSNDEAAVAAYQHIKTKRILATVGAVAATAAIGYTAYKMHDNRVDKIIKSGTLLQNIAPDDNVGLRDAFYSSKHGLDNVKYKGLYGSQLTKTKGGAVKNQIRVLSDIKQASHANAQKTLSDLIKNDQEFADHVKDYLEVDVHSLGNRYALKSVGAKQALERGTVNKSVYEIFNASLVDHDPDHQPAIDKYFKALADKGYNAVKDVNDSKYSGYKAINPIIAFNTKGVVDVVDVKKLTNDEIAKAKTIGYAHIFGSDLAKKGAVVTGAMLASNSISAKGKRTEDLATAEKYRKENPGTKLSNTEIVRMIERNG